MSITVFRIDDRLIHGQVVEGWLNKLDIRCVVVANDMVASDIMQQTLMKMAVPNDIEIYIDTIAEIANKFNNCFFDCKKKVMILVSSPKDAYELIEKGVSVDSLNVGGIHYKDGKMQILEFLSVDEKDCEYFNLIYSKNIFIEGRSLPDFEKVDIIKNIKNLEIYKKK